MGARYFDFILTISNKERGKVMRRNKSRLADSDKWYKKPSNWATIAICAILIPILLIDI